MIDQNLSLIEQLISALRVLPGVGPKSAQRMAFHILERDRSKGLILAKALQQAIDKVQHCHRCHTLSEQELCSICGNPRRDGSVICIVETPADVLAIEQTKSYRGLYYVLMGHLSPLDGIGPEEIRVSALMQILAENPIREVILATNPTTEGEATAHYLANLIQARNIKCSRIACGVPMGGELEYADGFTLARAFAGRIEIPSLAEES